MGLSKGSISAISGFVGSSVMFTIANFTTMIKAVYIDMTSSWSWSSILLAASITLWFLSFGLIIKDVVDGGKFTTGERKRAILALGLGVMLFFGGSYIGKYLPVTHTLTDLSQDQVRTATSGSFSGVVYEGPSQTLYKESAWTSPNYLTLAAANDTDYTTIYIKFNQTGMTTDFIKSCRGFNITCADDGITAAYLRFASYTGGVVHTTLLSSALSEITIADMGTYSTINATWTALDALTFAINDYENMYDCYFLQLTIDTDYTETNAVTLTFSWLTTYGADWDYIATFVMWCGSGLLPFGIMTGFTRQLNAFKYSKKYRRYNKNYRSKGYSYKDYKRNYRTFYPRKRRHYNRRKRY